VAATSAASKGSVKVRPPPTDCPGRAGGEDVEQIGKALHPVATGGGRRRAKSGSRCMWQRN